ALLKHAGPQWRKDEQTPCTVNCAERTIMRLSGHVLRVTGVILNHAGGSGVRGLGVARPR
ncbi:MAG: hypothetical protein ACKOZX_15375, partial [Gammaproteobacteria bacterium]